MSTNRPSDRPRIALIAGPTASGKSARAIALAEREHGTVINADASQVYRDLRILSARPSAEEEARVPHRLFGYRDGAQACSAADWAADAKAAVAETLAAGRLPVLVGGTGLYIRTLLDGIAPVPEIEPQIRAAVRTLTAAEAHAALLHEDPAAAARLHPNDTGRLQRALEVIRSTGRPIAAWRESRVGGIADSVRIELETILMPVAELYARCDERVDRMIAAGAVAEVAALRERRLDPALPVMRAIGVNELSQWLDAKLPLEEAVAAVKQATRNYAKRQRTWLRHQMTGSLESASRGGKSWPDKEG
jgi:tRNA dimethylallyltransferase